MENRGKKVRKDCYRVQRILVRELMDYYGKGRTTIWRVVNGLDLHSATGCIEAISRLETKYRKDV